MKNFSKIGISLAAVGIASSALAQLVDVTVDGRQLSDQARTIDGRVYVPLRGIFQALGAEVNYSSATRSIRASKGNKQIYLPVGGRTASIDGREVTLDAPARSIGGVTMVPLRFVGEAFGANVNWQPAQRLVAINTIAGNGGNNGNVGGAPGRLTPEEREARRREREERLAREREEKMMNTVSSGTIIPVKLVNALDSASMKDGQRFTATIDTTAGSYYGGFPTGSIIEGYVARSDSRDGNENGQLDLRFDRLRLPTGRAIAIDGTLTTLDNNAVERDDSGRIIARAGAKSNNTVLGGLIGGAAGLIFGGNRKLENTVLAGALGALIGSQVKNGGGTRNVVLKPGTVMGVKLQRDVVLYDGGTR